MTTAIMLLIKDRLQLKVRIFRHAKKEINLQTQHQLPYVQIQTPSLKLLIGTGANQSFSSPDTVEKYLRDIPLNYDPFEVSRDQ